MTRENGGDQDRIDRPEGTYSDIALSLLFSFILRSTEVYSDHI